MEFASAFLQREVEVLVLRADRSGRLHTGGGHFVVRPPTVREAVVLIEVLEAASGEGEDAHDAWFAARQVLRSWLPPSLASLLAAEATDRASAVDAVAALLQVGVPAAGVGAGRFDEAERALRLRARSESWSAVIADFASVYGYDPLGLPFPHFVLQHALLDEARAKHELALYRALTLASPYGEAEEHARRYDRLLVRAGLDAASLEAYRMEDALRRQREALPRISAKIQQLRDGGALA